MSRFNNQKAAPKWEPKKKHANDGKIFTISKGNIEPIDLKSISEYKKGFEKPIGKVFFIEKPESLLNKEHQPQTKLWYYDKRNYSKGTEDVKLDFEDGKRSKFLPIPVPKGQSFHTIESITKSLKYYRFN
ncbi:hypothetical protein BpHYR1_023223 [Brachionus plicatilis]|uniref:Uncharacterized protein n=1 Tax=Brachionus plicatilis TaxID=10195 RepID=A0A3M7SSZ5_BRAPC|nr:hypothetical protein BpHYR1_023223 [Brachionus plicatilis]